MKNLVVNAMQLVDGADIAVDTEKFAIDIGLAETSFSASNRPDLNGLRVQLPGSPAIYLIDRGQKRYIPDPATFNNLFKNWSHYQDLDVDSIETGQPISVGAILAAPVGSGTIYLLDCGVKRHITAPSVMNKYNFNWDRVYKLPPIAIDNIPTGDPIV